MKNWQKELLSWVGHWVGLVAVPGFLLILLRSHFGYRHSAFILGGVVVGYFILAFIFVKVTDTLRKR